MSAFLLELKVAISDLILTLETVWRRSKLTEQSLGMGIGGENPVFANARKPKINLTHVNSMLAWR